MRQRVKIIEAFAAVLLGTLVILACPKANAQNRCEIPPIARDTWRCENGFIIGPQNVIVGLPISETDPEALYHGGVEAASREDWRAAIAYFTAAQQRAHLVPLYMYNLGLAHARAGNEVAAIAWLSTYLAAAPDAPNRAAIWEQIEDLEAQARQEIGLIYDRAAAAAQMLPDVPEDGYDRRGARSNAFRYLSDVAARDHDWVRANQYVQTSNSYLLASPYEQPLPARSEGSGTAPPATVAGEWPCEIVYYRFIGFHHLCLDNFSDRTPFDAQVLTAIWNGDRSRARALLQRWDGDTSNSLDWRALALALNGRNGEAQALIATFNAGFMGNLKEESAASVGGVLLRFGDVRGANAFARFAERFAEQERSSQFGYDQLISGWMALRLRAQILAEEGDAQAGIDLLRAQVSRQSVNWQSTIYADAPHAVWMRNRHDGAAVVASYLFDRGRIDEALQATLQLDSRRRLMVLDSFVIRAEQSGRPAMLAAIGPAREAALLASGETGVAAQHRTAINDAVRAATMLPGVCYGLDWWLAAAGRGELAGVGRWRGMAAISPHPLIQSVEGLIVGLHATQSAYVRAGGVWGQ